MCGAAPGVRAWVFSHDDSWYQRAAVTSALPSSASLGPVHSITCSDGPVGIRTLARRFLPHSFEYTVAGAGVTCDKLV